MLKNIILIMSGTILSQFLLFFSVPIITRMYGPDIYGYYGQILSISNIIAPIIAICIPIALAFEKDNYYREKLKESSLIVAMITCTVLFILTVTLYYSKEINWVFVLIPVYCFFNNLCDICRQSLVFSGKFKIISQGLVISSIASVGIKLTFGIYYPETSVLFMSMIIGLIFNYLLMMYIGGVSVKLKIDVNGTFDSIRRHADIIKFRPAQTLLSACAINAPVVILSAKYSQYEIGQYFVAVSLAGLPVMLLGKAITDSFYSFWNGIVEVKDKLKKNIIISSALILICGSLMTGLISPFSSKLFVWYLGEEWIDVGFYFNCLVLSSLGVLVTRPIVALIPIIKLQKQFLSHEVISFFLRLLTILVMTKIGFDMKEIIFMYSVVSLFSYLVIVFWVYYYVSKRS